MATEKRIEYPISPEYCKSWTIREAIREIIANAKDESGWYAVWYNQKEGRGYVKDKSEGVRLGHLVLGGGREKGQGEIGQFGEGLKIAALVMAREGRAMELRTVEYSFKPSIEVSEDFDTDVMVLTLNGNNTEWGTEISFDCSKEELMGTQALFRRGRADGRTKILRDQPGALYINGVFAQTITSLLGYDIADKEAANRDRSVLDMVKVKAAIELAWNVHMKDPATILRYVREAGDGCIEHNISFRPHFRGVWKRVIEHKYGKCCISSGTTADYMARDMGYTILPSPSSCVDNTLRSCGFHYSNTVAHAKVKGKSMKNHLSPRQRATISKATKLVQRKLGVRVSVSVVDRLDNGDRDGATRGEYLGTTPQGAHRMRITVEVVNQGVASLAGTMAHEATHGTSHASDLTRQFERALTDVIGRLIAR